jgi:hypothetical protein
LFRVRFLFAAGLDSFQLFSASAVPAAIAALAPALAPAIAADFTALPTRTAASRPLVNAFFADFLIVAMVAP